MDQDINDIDDYNVDNLRDKSIQKARDAENKYNEKKLKELKGLIDEAVNLGKGGLIFNTGFYAYKSACLSFICEQRFELVDETSWFRKPKIVWNNKLPLQRINYADDYGYGYSW